MKPMYQLFVTSALQPDGRYSGKVYWRKHVPQKTADMMNRQAKKRGSTEKAEVHKFNLIREIS